MVGLELRILEGETLDEGAFLPYLNDEHVTFRHCI